MWQAFGGYGQVYDSLPSGRTVRRVRLWLAAVNEYERELDRQSKEKMEEAEREHARLASQR